MNKSTSLRWPTKYNLEKLVSAFYGLFQHGVTLYILEQFVESPLQYSICRCWKSTHLPLSHLCLSKTVPLVSSFNYRFAYVFIYTLLTKDEVFCFPSYHLWIIHLLPPSLSLSGVFFSHFCLLVTCTVECLALLNTLKMLSLPVGGKSFHPAMSLMWWPIYKMFLLLSIHANKTLCSFQIQKPHLTVNILSKILSFGSDGEQLFIPVSS